MSADDLVGLLKRMPLASFCHVVDVQLKNRWRSSEIRSGKPKYGVGPTLLDILDRLEVEIDFAEHMKGLSLQEISVSAQFVGEVDITT
jgi:hypothetical protein